jgi:hypothetical protein
MIVWPEEKRMKPEARDALRRFRETSAAADLDTATETWRVVAWPWTSELPQRVLLENPSHGVVAFTLGEGGMWLMSEEPRAVHVRSVEALERDAQGLPNLAG